MKLGQTLTTAPTAPPATTAPATRTKITPRLLDKKKHAAIAAAHAGASSLGGTPPTPRPSTGATNGTADHPQRPRPTPRPAPTGTADHPHIPRPTKKGQAGPPSSTGGGVAPAPTGTSGRATPALRRVQPNGPTATPGVLPSQSVHHDHGARVLPELPAGRPPKRIDGASAPSAPQPGGFSWSDLERARSRARIDKGVAVAAR